MKRNTLLLHAVSAYVKDCNCFLTNMSYQIKSNLFHNSHSSFYIVSECNIFTSLWRNFHKSKHLTHRYSVSFKRYNTFPEISVLAVPKKKSECIDFTSNSTYFVPYVIVFAFNPLFRKYPKCSVSESFQMYSEEINLWR